ncbi:hypothetical protein ZOSMA_63G00320 [Zostera marina]|uniref:Agenet domain-containing protein n=1 Tax=Zostera marina TaxID=29655 RepID=A0A0K9NVA7_ZOSMR|nr:hypothetical protein ZOSMA_63G00320 [Zostera marina]
MARNPKMQAKKKERRILYFAKSDRVEVEHLHNTISRAWFEATIRKTHLQTGRYTVIYNTLYLPDGRRLYDVIDSCHVRPLPPSNTTTSSSSITTNQKVEVFHNDGWWIGVVISKLDDTDGGKFLVSLPNSNGEDEKIEFASSRIRVHLDWDSSNDKWVLVENEDAMPETEEKKHGHDQKPKMPCAMNVIVLSDDD